MERLPVIHRQRGGARAVLAATAMLFAVSGCSSEQQPSRSSEITTIVVPTSDEAISSATVTETPTSLDPLPQPDTTAGTVIDSTTAQIPTSAPEETLTEESMPQDITDYEFVGPGVRDDSVALPSEPLEDVDLIINRDTCQTENPFPEGHSFEVTLGTPSKYIVYSGDRIVGYGTRQSNDPAVITEFFCGTEEQAVPEDTTAEQTTSSFPDTNEEELSPSVR